MPVVKIRFFTKDKIELISEDNKNKFEKYYQSCTIRSSDTKDTTYKCYRDGFFHFMAYLALKYNNVGLYSEEFSENAIDILESYMSFCQNTLKNHGKVINNKISAISSFYIWSLKRGLVKNHPFDKKLDRMKGANEEHIINDYYLTPAQTRKITRELYYNDRYDIQDQIIFSLMYDSANRIGAIEKLTLSSLDMNDMVFNDVREKEGYKVQVIFMQETKEIIERWFEIRKDMDNLTVDSLFITKQNGKYKQMAKNTIQKRINKIGEIIGLADFHAHCIRKTRLSDVYDITGDLALTAELANHKSTETTRSCYIKPKTKVELRNRLEQITSNKKEVNHELTVQR